MYTKAAAWRPAPSLPTYMERSRFQDGPETNMEQIWYLISVTSETDLMIVRGYKESIQISGAYATRQTS